MISVAEAQALCLGVARPLGRDKVALTDAAGRVFLGSVMAGRAQPPCDVSAMDGYAIDVSDNRPGAVLDVVGASAAGRGWAGRLRAGQACRIFTGAPVPAGASHVVVQEKAARHGSSVTLTEASDRTNIRPRGADFQHNFSFHGPRVLRPADLALLASMNHGCVTVGRRPTVAILSTGDELVMPGGTPGPDQIVASNVFALDAMVRDAGGLPDILPIAGDSEAALHAAFEAASNADILVTVGGASVGDHDLVSGVAQARGIELVFHKIAMRPGKPLMAGAFGDAAFLGLPGNPISAIVCGHLFLMPMVRQMQGLENVVPTPLNARLEAALGANGPRAHYMRAQYSEGAEGRRVQPFDRQDSALLSVLSEANCLLVRPPHAGAQDAGDLVQILPI